MDVGSEDIEGKLRQEAEDLSIDALWERAELCTCSDNPQPKYGLIFYGILKERDPSDERAYIGLAQCLLYIDELEPALKELSAAKEIISRLSQPEATDAFDNFLYAQFLQYAIEVRTENKASEFRLKLLEGLRQRSMGNHPKARKFFLNAAKHGSGPEKEEAIFYTATLYGLPDEMIETSLRMSTNPPRFFWKLPEHEKEYLLKARKHIQDTYLPCATPEQIRRNFREGRNNRNDKHGPISRDEVEEAKLIMESVNTIEDLGF
ncbi:hypothetical protein GF371_02520 [Candidatus Woesearchaeota archaeon]|nr:hypothetical protein [Candidatus Woesearchaeota archaeon]